MSLGILNNISAIYAGNNLNNTQASLQNVLKQLSSGARINSGADDAAGLAIADGLKANENALTQSVQNAANGTGLLQTADGALSQVTSLLDRAVTLATEAANGTLSSAQVSSANQEYQSILTEINNIGSTTNYNGNTVFTTANTSIYVGDGTSTGSNSYSVPVGTLSATGIGQTAGAVGGVSVANPATPSTNVKTAGYVAPASHFTSTTGTAGTASSATYAFQNANDVVGGTFGFVEAGGITTTATVTAGSTLASAVAQLNAAFAAGPTALTATQGVGGSANKIYITENGTVGGAVTGTGTLVDDTTSSGLGSFSVSVKNATDTLGGTLAFAQGTTTATFSLSPGTTLAQAVTAINTAGSTFQTAGITAAVSGLNLVLTSNTGGQGAFLTSTVGSSVTDTQATLKLAVPAASNSNYSAGVGTASSATFAALQTATDNIVGTLNVAVGAGSVIAVQIQAGSSLASTIAQLNGNAQLKAANVVASSSGNSLILTGPVGTAANPTGTTLSLAGTALTDTPVTTATGAGVDFTASSVAQLTTASAQTVLTSVNAAIADVAYQRGILGAYTNEINAASNTAASENVNLTAAESSIRSTNYGTATSDLAKFEVLSQTGISALAQANTVQQEILKLLQ